MTEVICIYLYGGGVKCTSSKDFCVFHEWYMELVLEHMNFFLIRKKKNFDKRM